MTKTRRKAKEDAASSPDTHLEEGPSDSSAAAQSLTVSIPEDLDHQHLSEILPEIPDISSVTPDVVVFLYKLVATQYAQLDDWQRQLDELQADVERKDVELDQALQDKESLSKELEGSVDSVQRELEQIKQEREKLVEENDALKAQVSSLSNSQTSSVTEVEALKHRVEDTDREKRDLVGVVSRLKQEASQREEEVQSLRTNLKEARQEHQTLESQIRELKSTETSTKFKLDSLAQQLQLAQSEAERATNELTTKTEESSRYRRTKHAELLNLQSSYDSLSQEHTSTLASLKALQSTHSAQTNQLTQALSKIQTLTGQIAEQEAKYANEANSLKRLVTMMEEREKGAKSIVENIEKEWASVGERAEMRENALRQQLEQEKERCIKAEKKAEQLEVVLHRMGRGDLPVPGTPSRNSGTPDNFDGMMGLSPTVALAKKAQTGGKTFTEVYADYVRLQEEYVKKCTEHSQMDATLAAVLAEIEERAPILSQQRAEYDRVALEASELSAQLAQALADRDAQGRLADEQSQKLSKSNAENSLLQKQLTDLGRQVQTLLRDIARRDDPTIPADEDLDNVPFTPANDVDEIITNNLVLFRNIDGLQQQNQKLLKITRELGEKMETEERDYKAAMEQEQAEAIREAHEAMQELASQLEIQKKNSDHLIQSYMKERDTLKSMLARAEAAGVNGAHFASSSASTPAMDSDTAQELAEIQSQFEAYKMEMGVDSTRLRDDLTAAQREIHELNTSLVKANAKIEYLNDRHRMHQEQFKANSRDLEDLSKRNQALFDQWTRVDVECSRLSEDLHVATSRVEQLRNECANLRAEKKIWESVQSRLMEENKTLAMERSHLSDLMANVQKMHNDLERSGENDRRRLEGQLQMLEGQTQDLRTQLNRERDSLRHVSLQKDVEAKEQQSRLEKANQELAKTREALVGAETSKKHFEERVEELTKQAHAIQEKLGVYERRPSTTTSGPAPSSDPDLSREQQLEQEVAELRSALKVAEVDLASAKGHVEQFREISQANEAALSSLNSTFDDYKASTESQIARQEAEYKALQEKLEASSKELAELREQNAALHKNFEEQQNAWKNDKKTLEEAIIDMTTSEKHLESDRSSREEEVRSVEERAKAAEERYTHEVVAHAESIKTIEQLRRELSTAQNKARDGQTASQTAQAKLAASESSWRQQKDTLDKEMSDLRTRYNELSSQNSVLHQHLESVSSQAARIRQAAEDSSAAPSGEGDSSDDADTKVAELRSVVSYLRKEKEIVDLQLELSKQENTRLKAQIEHLSQSLQEARATISEERERAVESAASAAQHAELVERINQLNILRESNATLRADCESHAKKARDLDTKLKQLSAELEPAKEQARDAQAELEACKAQIQRLEQESHGWQERNKQLLSKYDRIDPSEVQALKDEIEKLKAEVEEAKSSKAAVEEAGAGNQAALDQQTQKFENLDKTFRAYKEGAMKSIQSFRTKLGELNAQKSALAEEKRQLEAKLSNLEAGSTAPDPAQAEELKRHETVVASLKAERDKLLAEKESWSKAPPAQAGTSEAPANWETEKSELAKARDEALEKLKNATAEAQKAVADARNIRMQNEKFHARLAALTKARASEQERTEAAVAQAIEKTKGEMQGASGAASPELIKKHAEELQKLRSQLQAKHEAELKAAVEAASKVTGATGDQKAAIDAALVQQKKNLEEEHGKEIEAARDSGRMEAATKIKIKDSQLTKAAKRVKELEAQIREWEASGTLPANSLSSITANASLASIPGQSTAAQGATPKAAMTTTAQPKTGAAAGQSPVQGHAATLPRRPAAAGAAPTAGGVARGAAPARGAPARGRALPPGARAAPSRPLPTKSTAAAPGGMSIMGAAAAAAASTATPKRPREEPDAGGQDDSLAKRLKPAESPAAAGSGTPPPTKPVQLRRPPPGS